MSYYYYYSTLVTTYLYYFIILFVSLFFVLIFTKDKTKLRSILLIKTIKLALLIYFVFFSFLFIMKNKTNLEIFKTPLNGYYTVNIDGVLFRFQNKNFDRKFNLKNYPQADLKKRYEVKLELRQPLSNIYFIQTLSLIEK